MHRPILPMLLLLALAACAPKQPPATAGVPAPLGPCPVTSWRPEAPPPTASARTSMILLAVQEWARFGRQTATYPDGKSHLEQLGVQEREASERVRDYWKSVDRPDLSGMNTEVPWSAAFISWDIASAGVPHDLFCPDVRHTIYVERLVERAKRPGAALIPRRLNERRPEPGDLLCSSRANGTTTLDNLDRGPGHCDIVVLVRPGAVEAIGGNVSDSVTRSVFPLDETGFLSPIAARPFFTVIENRLP